MDEEQIRKAFSNVRQDVDNMRNELKDTRELMIEICEIIKKLEQKQPDFTSTHVSKEPTQNFDTSTHDPQFKALKPQDLPISTGNQGVPTDRQTDRQTHKQTQNPAFPSKNDFENATELLDSLDSIKKEIRLKFKRLTDQELLVFSTLYQLEEEKGFTDYKTISERLNLTESSIRDYVGRLIKKGIPVDKVKVNNKNIQLTISNNLKKLASLSTILKLRDI
jgi:hypothetical protein